MTTSRIVIEYTRVSDDAAILCRRKDFPRAVNVLQRRDPDRRRWRLAFRTVAWSGDQGVEGARRNWLEAALKEVVGGVQDRRLRGELAIDAAELGTAWDVGQVLPAYTARDLWRLAEKVDLPMQYLSMVTPLPKSIQAPIQTARVIADCRRTSEAHRRDRASRSSPTIPSEGRDRRGARHARPPRGPEARRDARPAGGRAAMARARAQALRQRRRVTSRGLAPAPLFGGILAAMKLATALPVLSLALAACGPNYRYVYDGEAAFERCYALDYDENGHRAHASAVLVCVAPVVRVRGRRRPRRVRANARISAAGTATLAAHRRSPRRPRWRLSAPQRAARRGARSSAASAARRVLDARGDADRGRDGVASRADLGGRQPHRGAASHGGAQRRPRASRRAPRAATTATPRGTRAGRAARATTPPAWPAATTPIASACAAASERASAPSRNTPESLH